jgi:hypothetical protein
LQICRVIRGWSKGLLLAFATVLQCICEEHGVSIAIEHWKCSQQLFALIFLLTFPLFEIKSDLNQASHLVPVLTKSLESFLALCQ